MYDDPRTTDQQPLKLHMSNTIAHYLPVEMYLSIKSVTQYLIT